MIKNEPKKYVGDYNVDAVRDALRETMPVFLAGCMTGMAQNPAAVSPQLVKEPVKDSINWDFVGG